MFQLTFKKSLSQTTSGLGSPITSHIMMTVSPSNASLQRGRAMNNGSLEYLKKGLNENLTLDE